MHALALQGAHIPLAILVPLLGVQRPAGDRQVTAEHQPEHVPLGTEGERAVLELVDDLGQPMETLGGIDRPVRHLRHPAGGLGDDVPAQRMEGARFHLHLIQAEALERAVRTRLQLGGGFLVEGEHDDALGRDQPAFDGVRRLGDHCGGFARTCCGHHLDAVVEADHRAGLLIGEWPAFDAVQQRTAGDPFARLMDLIAARPHRWPVGQPQHQRFFDRGRVAIELAAQVGIIEHRPQRVLTQGQGGACLQQCLLLLAGQPQRFLVGQIGSRLHLGEPVLDGGVGLLEQGDMVALALLAASLLQCRHQQARGRGGQAAEDQRWVPFTMEAQPCPGQARVHLQCIQRRVIPMTVNGQ